MTYGDLKDLNRGKTTDKVFLDKTCNIATNLKYDGYQSWLALIA